MRYYSFRYDIRYRQKVHLPLDQRAFRSQTSSSRKPPFWPQSPRSTQEAPDQESQLVLIEIVT